MSLERTENLELPVLALRDVVVYPHMVIPLFVGREKSIKCLDAAMDNGKLVFFWRNEKPKWMTRIQSNYMKLAQLLVSCSY